MIDVKQLIISLTTLMSAVVQGYILMDVAASVLLKVRCLLP
jgi:hypothetical protein